MRYILNHSRIIVNGFLILLRYSSLFVKNLNLVIICVNFENSYVLFKNIWLNMDSYFKEVYQWDT